MDHGSDLMRSCEKYLSQTLMGRSFDEVRFLEYMEPVFKRLGYRVLDRTKRECILVIRLDGLTGAVLTTGFLRELRQNKPQACIVLVTDENSAPLMEQCPYIDEMHSFSLKRNMAFQEMFRFVYHFCQKYLWNRNYDLCLLPKWGDSSVGTILLAYLSGARERIGFASVELSQKSSLNRNLDVFLTEVLEAPADVIHETARGYYLLQRAGMKIAHDELELWTAAHVQEKVERFLSNHLYGRPFIAVGIGASQASCKYPVDKYLKAFQKIAETGMQFVLLGGAELDLEGQFFLRQMPRGSVINLIGQTRLPILAAVLSKAMLYIGNENDLVAMAAACEIPVIELLAEAEDKMDEPAVYSSYERFFPWKTPSIILRPTKALPPCNETAVLGGCCTMMPHCIRLVEPEDIVKAYREMMEYLEYA